MTLEIEHNYVPVFYCRIKYKYEFGCVWIKSGGHYRIKKSSFPSLCIGENHGTILK